MDHLKHKSMALLRQPPCGGFTVQLACAVRNLSWQQWEIKRAGKDSRPRIKILFIMDPSASWGVPDRPLPVLL